MTFILGCAIGYAVGVLVGWDRTVRAFEWTVLKVRGLWAKA